MITFWFEFASTYSYIAAERLRRLGETPPRTVWRPFLLGPIFKAQGYDTSPFNLLEAKGAYMWRDVERLAEAEGLGFGRPDPFPQNGLLAARVATAHEAAPWLVDFVCGVYRAEFAEARDISTPEVIGAALSGLGVDAADALGRAQDPAVKARLRAATVEAEARGVFGAPCFTIGDELFWGQDRLDDALRWRDR